MKLSLIDCSLRKLDFSLACSFPIDPLSNVCRVIQLTEVLSLTVLLVLSHRSHVRTSIRPHEFPFSLHQIILKVSFIYQSVLPPEGSLAVEEAMLYLSSVLVAILKLDGAFAIQRFEVKLVLLVVEFELAAPFLVEMLGYFYRQNVHRI